MESRPAEIDPVARALQWTPVRHGGSRFKGQKLEIEGDQARVSPTLAGQTFGIVMSIPAFITAPLSIFAFLDGKIGAGIQALVFALVFGGAGWWLLGMNKTTVFDRNRDLYFRGKKPGHGKWRNRDKQGKLSDIHALQFLSERIMPRGRGGRGFLSYEINLVFANGERINVMDHGDKPAAELARLLGVPVWDQPAPGD